MSESTEEKRLAELNKERWENTRHFHETNGRLDAEEKDIIAKLWRVRKNDVLNKHPHFADNHVVQLYRSLIFPCDHCGAEVTCVHYSPDDPSDDGHVLIISCPPCEKKFQAFNVTRDEAQQAMDKSILYKAQSDYEQELRRKHS